MRCRVEHKKVKFISTSRHVIFCLLHKHTNDNVFDDFLKISQNCFKGKMNVSEHFSDISEDFQGGTDDVSIIQHI